jgi:hypothetical protein
MRGARLISLILLCLALAPGNPFAQQSQINPAEIRAQYQKLVSDTLHGAQSVRSIESEPAAQAQLGRLAANAAEAAIAAAQAGDNERAALVQRNLEKLLMTTVQNNQVNVRGGRTITLDSVDAALKQLCPLYPFC